MLLVDLADGDVSAALRKYLPADAPDCAAIALSIKDWLSVVPDRNAGGAVSIDFEFGYGIRATAWPAIGVPAGKAVLLRDEEFDGLGRAFGVIRGDDVRVVDYPRVPLLDLTFIR